MVVYFEEWLLPIGAVSIKALWREERLEADFLNSLSLRSYQLRWGRTSWSTTKTLLLVAKCVIPKGQLWKAIATNWRQILNSPFERGASLSWLSKKPMPKVIQATTRELWLFEWLWSNNLVGVATYSVVHVFYYDFYYNLSF